MKVPFLILALSLLLAGCWTFNETPYPTVKATPAAANSKTVHLAGFEAVLTEWEAVHGYRTVYIPSRYGYDYYEPGCFETVPSVSYIPQRRSTDMFLLRAQDMFEKSGFVLAPTTSDYTVSVHFEGPFVDVSNDLKQFALNVCTLFFCDWSTAQWTAKLRIRETKTGRLVFNQDYVQSYSTCVFSVIPLFGTASCRATDAAHMQSWCLAALTDRACADATSFVARGS